MAGLILWQDLVINPKISICYGKNTTKNRIMLFFINKKCIILSKIYNAELLIQVHQKEILLRV